MKTLIAVLMAAALSAGTLHGAVEKAKERPRTAPEEVPGLFAVAETVETADDIAALYGITLASYDEEGMVACYYNTSGMSDKELAELGEQNDWPPIERNRTTAAY